MKRFARASALGTEGDSSVTLSSDGKPRPPSPAWSYLRGRVPPVPRRRMAVWFSARNRPPGSAQASPGTHRAESVSRLAGHRGAGGCGPASLAAEEGWGSCGLTRRWWGCGGWSPEALCCQKHAEESYSLGLAQPSSSRGSPLITSFMHRRKKQSPERRGSCPVPAGGGPLRAEVWGQRFPALLVACGPTPLCGGHGLYQGWASVS